MEDPVVIIEVMRDIHANNDFFEALSMLEHERGITAEYLIEKIKAAIVIAVKKNYEVEDDLSLIHI